MHGVCIEVVAERALRNGYCAAFAEHFGCHRLLLACTTLAFTHPATGEALEVKAPVSGEFAATLAQLGWEAALQ